MVTLNIKQIQAIVNEMLKETVDILNRNGIVFYMGYGSVLGTIRHNGSIPWDSDVDILVPISMLDKARACLQNELSDRFMVHDTKNDKRYFFVFPRVALSKESSCSIHLDIFPLIGLPEDRRRQVKLCNRLEKKCKLLVTYKQFRRLIVHKTFLRMSIGKCIELFCSPFSCRQLIKQYHRMLKDYSYDDADFVTSGGACYGIKNILPKDIYGTPVWKDYCDFKVPVPEKWDEYLKNYYKDYMKYPSEEERNRGLAFTFDISDEEYEMIKDVLGE